MAEEDKASIFRGYKNVLHGASNASTVANDQQQMKVRKLFAIHFKFSTF